MEMIFVKPAAGGRVRQPERMSRIMPDAGDFVPRNAHYERLLATGDVIEAAAPPEAAPAAPVEEPTVTNAPSSGRSRRASGASEE